MPADHQQRAIGLRRNRCNVDPACEGPEIGASFIRATAKAGAFSPGDRAGAVRNQERPRWRFARRVRRQDERRAAVFTPAEQKRPDSGRLASFNALNPPGRETRV